MRKNAWTDKGRLLRQLENKLNGLQTAVDRLERTNEERAAKLRNALIKEQRQLEQKHFRQVESFHWLTRRLQLKGRLQHLRSWAISPDVLLHLHEYLMVTRPSMVVEFGSGVSTLVMADALHQNGHGKLISIEHSVHYGELTRESLRREELESWVDLRIGELEPWTHVHLNQRDGQAALWYPQSLLEDIEGIDMVLVDGPPGATCQYARYPALPALVERLSANATLWMDDTQRKEEKDICAAWAQRYGFSLEFIKHEKGLGVLSRQADA